MQEKTCSKCGETKPIGEYPKDKHGLYGVRGDCKECRKINNASDATKESKRRYDKSEKAKAKGRRYRERNAESLRQRKRISYQKHIETEKVRRQKHYTLNSKILLERSRQYKSSNPEKIEAQHAVLAEVRKGTIPKASECVCRTCGQQAAHYHHESYAPEDRLKVVPLCNSCHVRVHKGSLVLA